MTKATSFTITNLGCRIRNKWVIDGLSEILGTFILSLFVYASGAQFILSRGTVSSPMGSALTSGAGLTFAVYTAYNASGGAVNPGVALMFCLLGKIPWKKYPLYFICEFIGAFLAAALTFAIYYDLIEAFDHGQRKVFGPLGTSDIFCSFPHPNITQVTGFFHIVVGSGLLSGLIAAVIDPKNAAVSDQLIPLIFTFLLYAIVMSFGYGTMAAINMAIDVSGRLLCYLVGYGAEVWTNRDYWFWIPPVACLVGTVLSCFIYQFMVGNHLPEPWEVYSKKEPEVEVEKNGNAVPIKSYESTNSVVSNNTLSTFINEHM